MAQKFVGVDLGSHHVKVVVVSGGLRGVQVVDAFSSPVGPIESDDPEADPLGPVLAVALGMLKERRLLSYPIGLAIPANLCSYRVLSFPFSDERRITQAVGFEAEGQFPIPTDELHYGHIVVPSADAGGRALVAAARRDRVDSIYEVCKRAGIDFKAMTSGPLAMAQVAARPAAVPLSAELSERGLEPVTLLVDLGHGSTQMVALGPKGPHAVRTTRRGGEHITAAIAQSYQLSEAEAETAKHSDAFLPHHGLEQMSEEQLDAGRIVARALEPVLKQIGQTRMWLRATYKLEVNAIRVAGGGAALQGLIPYLKEHSGLDVELFAPDTAHVKGTEGREWSAYAGALGAAYGAARRPLLSLHDASTSDAGGSVITERISSLLAIGVAVLAFGALDTIAQVKAFEAEKAAYDEELAVATRATFGKELSPSEILVALDSVEGQDLTSLVPERGALEVLAMLVEAATPSDLGQAPPAPGRGAIDPLTGQPALGGPGGSKLDPVTGQPVESDEDEDEDEDDDEPERPKEVIETTQGIVISDELTFSSVDIRERKIELKVDANASTAQDRLKYKLQQHRCITNIQNGKVRGTERRNFEMSMDNGCYYASEEEDAEGSSEARG